jgi:hypothetical protein
LEGRQDCGDVEVGIDMGSADPTHHCGDIAIKLKETCRNHGFPILANGSSAFPMDLETLEWKEVNVPVPLSELLELWPQGLVRPMLLPRVLYTAVARVEMGVAKKGVAVV